MRGLDPLTPAQTCTDIYETNPWLPSGDFYYINPNAGGTFRVFCDMDNGGWTLFCKRVAQMLTIRLLYIG